MYPSERGRLVRPEPEPSPAGARVPGRLSPAKLAPVIAIVLVAAIVFATGSHRHLSLETLVRNRAALDQQDWCACAGAQVTARVITSLRRARVECLVEREHVHALVSDGGARGDPLPAVHGP